MKGLRCFIALVCVAGGVGCKPPGPAPSAVQGTIFIRQQICDIDDFKKAFLRPGLLASQGFTAYGIYRDLQDPKTYILTFQCSDLDKAVECIRSSSFHIACVGAGLGLPLMWAGVDIKPLRDIPPKSTNGGLVVVRYEVRDYGAWEKNFEADHRWGIHTDSDCLYRLAGNPHSVILAYETPDPRSTLEDLDSHAFQNAQEASGVTRREVWSGLNLEEGTF